jgi:hypothetical protein
LNFIQVRSFDNYISANLLLSLLKDADIDCYLKDEYTITIDPLLSPAIGGMKLMVIESDLKQALEIVETAEKDFIRSFACTNCGNKTLELVEKIVNPVGLWQKIRFLLEYGQEQEITRFYHCTTCNSVFENLPVTSQ